MTTGPDDEERWIDGDLESGADDAGLTVGESVPASGDIPDEGAETEE